MTLITGDQVLVTGRGHQVRPGPGRNVDFTSQVREGHLYVFPSDAMPLIAQGMLDRAVVRRHPTAGLAVRRCRQPRHPRDLTGRAGPQGTRQARQLASVGISALRVPKASAARTWKELTGARSLAAGQAKLWLDGRRSFSLDQSVKQIGAPQAWQQGMTGKGVTVAVLDSGYDPDHPDLKDAVVQERNFSDDPDIRDTIGHGTHVASTVSGRGEKYRGVAPEAKLAIGKVGGATGMTDSGVLAGMEWAAVEVGAKVVNMSLGAPDDPDLDPLEQAVNTLSERTGTLFVVAAGTTDPRSRVLARQRRRGADGGRGGQAGSPGRLLQPWPPGGRPRDQTRAHRAGRGHRGRGPPGAPTSR